MYTPEKMIVLYGKVERGGTADYHQTEIAYAESHRIVNGKVLDGRPLLLKELRALKKLSEPKEERKKKVSISGEVPERLLYYYSHGDSGNLRFIWWAPASQRNLVFEKQLGIQNGKASCPPLLFMVNAGKLNAFAMRENKRPDEKTKLYRAPFHNIGSIGDVCLGNASKPRAEFVSTFNGLIRAWEMVFFNSEFSHFLGGSPVKDGENLNLLWQRLIASGGAEPFPLDVLVEIKKKTYGSLINRIGG